MLLVKGLTFRELRVVRFGNWVCFLGIGDGVGSRGCFCKGLVVFNVFKGRFSNSRSHR